MTRIFLIFSLLITSITFGQNNGVIEGTVKDVSQSDSPMMYARVTIKETKQAMNTGFRGGYFFKNLKPGKYTLTFAFLGYESITKKVKIKNEKLVVDTALKPNTDISFDDVQLTLN